MEGGAVFAGLHHPNPNYLLSPSRNAATLLSPPLFNGGKQFSSQSLKVIIRTAFFSSSQCTFLCQKIWSLHCMINFTNACSSKSSLISLRIVLLFQWHLPSGTFLFSNCYLFFILYFWGLENLCVCFKISYLHMLTSPPVLQQWAMRVTWHRLGQPWIRLFAYWLYVYHEMC